MDKKLVGMLGLFFVGFVVFVSLVVFGQPIAKLTRANNAVVSAGQSLLFAWPLSVKANGADMIAVDVFIRSSNNLPISNKQIALQSTVGTVSAQNAVSDKAGKTTFTIKSTTPGKAHVTASVDNVQLERSLTISFE